MAENPDSYQTLVFEVTLPEIAYLAPSRYFFCALRGTTIGRGSLNRQSKVFRVFKIFTLKVQKKWIFNFQALCNEVQTINKCFSFLYKYVMRKVFQRFVKG